MPTENSFAFWPANSAKMLIFRLALCVQPQEHRYLFPACGTVRIRANHSHSGWENAMGPYGNPLTDYSPETEQYEWGQESAIGHGSVFNESQVMELASGLLEIGSEQDLEQFLGDLISKAGKAIGGFIKSPVGKALGGVLKSAAKVALPLAGGALGTFLGGPIGMNIGSSLGSMAGQVLGLELEGLSPEDREFEAARQFVRFAGETVKNALQAPGNIDPQLIAKSAAAEAARTYAPGLLSTDVVDQGRTQGSPCQGKWVRRGHKLIVFGA
jgi:hypothetical protein